MQRSRLKDWNNFALVDRFTLNWCLAINLAFFCTSSVSLISSVSSVSSFLVSLVLSVLSDSSYHQSNPLISFILSLLSSPYQSHQFSESPYQSNQSPPLSSPISTSVSSCHQSHPFILTLLSVSPIAPS